MKASTLFALTLALLTALGVVGTARSLGWFDRKPAPNTDPGRSEPIMVLVAKTNLFADITTTMADVEVRALRPDELSHYTQYRDKYLPANPNAANLLIVQRPVRADQPLLKEYFQDIAIPDGIGPRLENVYMRPVTVYVPKERAMGGVILLNEKVDVWLTSRICDSPDCASGIVRTACIAKGCKVIMKRNSLWTTLQAPSDDKPLSFTLQANPYRAMLIEYAQMKGQILLQPNATPRGMMMDPMMKQPGGMPVFSDPSSKEYADEDNRILQLQNGDRQIDDADLERVFGLQAMPGMAGPIRVRHISGIRPTHEQSFRSPGQDAYNGRPVTNNPGIGYSFRQPGNNVSSAGRPGAPLSGPGSPGYDPSCPTCNTPNPNYKFGAY